MKLDFNLCKDLLNSLLEELKKEIGEETILSFALFGSWARGDAKENSDIDILILHLEINFNPVKKFVEVDLRLKEKGAYDKFKKRRIYASPCPIFFTVKELKENPLILLDVMEHGIILFDKDNCLKNMLEDLKAKLKELGSKKVYLPDGSWYWNLKPDWKPGEVVEIKL